MPVVTRYEVACKVRCLGPWQRRSLYGKRRRKNPLATPPWRYIITPEGSHTVEAPSFMAVMKVVGRCTKRGGMVDLRERDATPDEKRRGWLTVALITLTWPEKGQTRGKRAISRHKAVGPKLSQGLASELDHSGVSGAGIRHDPAPDLLSDGRPSAD